jgi:hypothetical protein
MLSSEAAVAAAIMVSVRLHLMSLMLLTLLVFTAAIDNTAFLVVNKKATIQRVKGGERINVGITLYNAGSATAYDVSLTDDTWPSSLFSLVSGNTSQTWDKLEAGGSLSHSFIVESRIKGPFSGSPAVVKYRVASKSTLQVSAAAHYTVCHRNEFLVCTFTILDNDAGGNLDMAGWRIFSFCRRHSLHPFQCLIFCPTSQLRRSMTGSRSLQ